jgi:catechol 2,3-dioxygenase-like lactoylglutathione lyase family enzyme
VQAEEKETMFSHVMLGASDLAAAKAFYDATLGALGITPGFIDPKGRLVYATPTGVLMLSTPIDGKPASCANGGTIGFLASSPQAAQAWHAAGVAHGGTSCEDPPGLREANAGHYYLAYLRDPSGNKLCALHDMP